MPETVRYALPLLSAGQAQKEVTHNEAIARLDALLHLAVESRTVAAPAAPAGGTAWIVPADASADWLGRDGAVAALDDSGWSFVVPRDGCIAFVRDEGAFVHFAGGAWRNGWPVPALEIAGRAVLDGAAVPVEPPSGGMVVDVEARGALASLLAALQSLGLLASA